MIKESSIIVKILQPIYVQSGAGKDEVYGFTERPLPRDTRAYPKCDRQTAGKP